MNYKILLPKPFFAAVMLVALITLAACSGGGDGNGEGASGGGGGPVTYTLSGTISAFAGLQVDGDVNDLLAPYTANDSITTAQSIPNPVTIGGYVNERFAGPNGRLWQSGDIEDFFSTILAAGQTITLILGDVQQSGIMDVDLYLLKTDGTLVDFSISTTGNTESITVPSLDSYIILVSVSEGFSNYTLSVGQAPAYVTRGAIRLVDDFIPGEVIVHFKDAGLISASSAVTADSLANSVGLMHKAGAPGRAMLLRVGSDETARMNALSTLGIAREVSSYDDIKQQKLDTGLAVKGLRRRADVESADLNYIVKPTARPNDQYYSYQWHYQTINLPQAWDLTTGTAGVIVAVVDTGVILSHPDLVGQLVSGYDFVSDAARANDGDGIDSNPDDPGDAQPGASSFHGTHVAGTVGAAAGNTTGVAGVSWLSKIMPIRVLGIGGGTTYDVMQGMSYAAGLTNDSGTLPTQAADVINLSLGGGSYVQAEQDLIDNIRAEGVIVVAAAGNDALSEVHYPSSYNGVVSVSAIDIEKNLAPYSNFGSDIDVAAPGGDFQFDRNGDGYPDGVLSSGGDDSSGTVEPAYFFMQGTSMATSHVSGVAALMKAVHPAMTPAEFDTFLLNGDITEDLGSTGRDDSYGHGMIDAYKAVVAAKNANDGSPPTPNPTLVITPSSLNMGSTFTIATITATNGGGGAINVNAPTTAAAWLTVAADTVDGNGLGTYTVTVNRTSLSASIYTATITFSSDANTVNVPLIMEVSITPVTGNAGFHYILLINPDSSETIYQTEANAAGGLYNYTFTGVDGGTYLLFCGSDPNNDDIICDAGEACGAYTTLDHPDSLVVNRDMTGLNFDTGFVVNLGVESTGANRRRTFNKIKTKNIGR